MVIVVSPPGLMRSNEIGTLLYDIIEDAIDG